MLAIDLTGKRALVAGVADDAGFGFAIAKALAEAGAKVSVGTWPPALTIFRNLLERGKMDESRKLANGQLLQFEKIYALDAAYDTLADMPEELKANKRYKDVGDPTVAGVADRIRSDFGEQSLDILVHSLANGPEVKKPLLETSRRGYLEAVSVSAYSLVSMLARLGPHVETHDLRPQPMHPLPYRKLRSSQQLPILFAGQPPGHLPRFLLKDTFESPKEGFGLGFLLSGQG